MSPKMSLISLTYLIALFNFICLYANGFPSIEKNSDYSRATAKFRQVLDNLENQFLTGLSNNSLRDEDLLGAYNEYKNWDPKLRLEVIFTEPRGQLLVMLLVFYKQKQDVGEFKRLYFIVRPIYQKRASKERSGVQNLKLVANFLLNKPIDVDQLNDAKYEYNEMIQELLSLTAEEESRIASILDVISREDIQVIKDVIYPLVKNDESILSMESLRQLFLDKYRERGWSMENGKKKFFYQDFYQELLRLTSS